MKIYEIIFIGVALAMDAFALTIANCTTFGKTLNRKKEWAMPITFALFQFAMPVLGFYIGSIFSESLQKISGFLTAGIFFALSAKIVFDIIMEHREKKNPEKESEKKTLKFGIGTLLTQGVATSIDALLVGVTFAAKLTFSVFLASGIVGVITFAVVTLALFIGKSLGKMLGKYAVWAGAIILFALAVKELITALI